MDKACWEHAWYVGWDPEDENDPLLMDGDRFCIWQDCGGPYFVGSVESRNLAEYICDLHNEKRRG